MYPPPGHGAECVSQHRPKLAASSNTRLVLRTHVVVTSAFSGPAGVSRDVRRGDARPSRASCAVNRTTRGRARRKRQSDTTSWALADASARGRDEAVLAESRTTARPKLGQHVEVGLFRFRCGRCGESFLRRGGLGVALTHAPSLTSASGYVTLLTARAERQRRCDVDVRESHRVPVHSLHQEAKQPNKPQTTNQSNPPYTYQSTSIHNSSIQPIRPRRCG
jgi:hypothetical protein